MWSPAMVAWPDESRRRVELAQAGIPRVLLVAPGTAAPTDIGEDEDWVRLPASEQDIAARRRNLALRHRAALHLDDGVLRAYDRTVALSDREAAVLEIVLAHGDTVVPVALMKASLGPADGPDRAVHDLVHRLRSRLRPLGFDLFSARNRGYSLGLRDEVSTD